VGGQVVTVLRWQSLSLRDHRPTVVERASAEWVPRQGRGERRGQSPAAGWSSVSSGGSPLSQCDHRPVGRRAGGVGAEEVRRAPGVQPI